MKIDPYATLGVPKDADGATIKRAYRKASSAAHPDRGGDARAMTRVNVAYDILSDPARRERYDLGGEDLPPTPPLEQRARIQLAMAFQSVLEKPQRLNIPAAAKQFLFESKRKCQANISGMGEMMKHFERLKEDVQFKGEAGEPNVFLDQLNCAIVNLTSQLENTEDTRAAIERALELLAHYVSTIQDQPHQQCGAGYSLFDLLAGAR